MTFYVSICYDLTIYLFIMTFYLSFDCAGHVTFSDSIMVGVAAALVATAATVPLDVVK
jgi:hypothetical protein